MSHTRYIGHELGNTKTETRIVEKGFVAELEDELRSEQDRTSKERKRCNWIRPEGSVELQ